MNTNSELVKKLSTPEFRGAFVASQINIGVPFQIRALRKERHWTQPELAERAGMKQSRISAMEKPGGPKLNIETLCRLASAFDVGLEVRFVPFGELIDHNDGFNPDSFSVKSFGAELAEAEAPNQRVVRGTQHSESIAIYLGHIDLMATATAGYNPDESARVKSNAPMFPMLATSEIGRQYQ